MSVHELRQIIYLHAHRVTGATRHARIARLGSGKSQRGPTGPCRSAPPSSPPECSAGSPGCRTREGIGMGPCPSGLHLLLSACRYSRSAVPRDVHGTRRTLHPKPLVRASERGMFLEMAAAPEVACTLHAEKPSTLAGCASLFAAMADRAHCGGLCSRSGPSISSRFGCARGWGFSQCANSHALVQRRARLVLALLLFARSLTQRRVKVSCALDCKSDSALRARGGQAIDLEHSKLDRPLRPSTV